MVFRLSALLSAGLLIAMSNAAVAESGIASIYPHSYKGRRTASGQPFNPGAMTCAHRRHAFGTSLRVTVGGKSITCRVTDRTLRARARYRPHASRSARARLFGSRSGQCRETVARAKQRTPRAPAARGGAMPRLQ